MWTRDQQLLLLFTRVRETEERSVDCLRMIGQQHIEFILGRTKSVMEACSSVKCHVCRLCPFPLLMPWHVTDSRCQRDIQLYILASSGCSTSGCRRKENRATAAQLLYRITRSKRQTQGFHSTRHIHARHSNANKLQARANSECSIPNIMLLLLRTPWRTLFLPVQI